MAKKRTGRFGVAGIIGIIIVIGVVLTILKYVGWLIGLGLLGWAGYMFYQHRKNPGAPWKAWKPWVSIGSGLLVLFIWLGLIGSDAQSTSHPPAKTQQTITNQSTDAPPTATQPQQEVQPTSTQPQQTVANGQAQTSKDSGSSKTASSQTNASPSTPASSDNSGSTELKIVSSKLDVSRGGYASITIQTAPGASANIEVDYKSGPSHASGLGEKTADSSGHVMWSWKIGTNTTSGDWPVIITSNGHTIQTSVHVN